MKLIIDIFEEDFKIIKENVKRNNPLSPMNQEVTMTMIANGIPLKEGHWIKKDDKTSPQCSECGAITYKWSYCPICGAKMEE